MRKLAGGFAWRAAAVALLAAISPPFASANGVEGSEGTIWLVPHSHYDLAWLDTESETAKRIADTLSAHVALAVKDPEYRFVVDQVPEMEALRRYHPSAFGQLVELVKQGRAQLVGGFYVQPDENLPEGQTLLQIAVLGQRWLEATFGTRTRYAFDIDSFGHSAQMPQILNLAGMDRIAFARKGDKSRPRATEVMWKGADGESMALTHWMGKGYDAGQGVAEQARTVSQVQDGVMKLYNELAPKAASKNVLVPIGGDYVKPNPKLTAAARDWNTRNTKVKMNVGTLADFMDAVAAEAPQTVPAYQGEFNREFPGNYASRIWYKQTNRELEHSLITAEKLATMAALHGYVYPERSLDDAWRDLVMNQFHDILPATGVDGVYGPTEARYQAVQATASSVARDALAFIAAKLESDIGSVPADKVIGRLVLANPMNWDTVDVYVTEVPTAVGSSEFVLAGPDGREIPYQLLQGTVPLQMAFTANVPSMGYASYTLRAGKPRVDPKERLSEGVEGELVLERYRVRLTAGGSIGLLQSLTTGRRFVDAGESSANSKGKAANEITVCSDDSNAYFPDSTSSVLFSTEGTTTATSLFEGPVMSRLLSETDAADGWLTRQVRFYGANDRIDFITDLDWAGARRAVNVLFSTLADGQATCEIPGGCLERASGEWPVLKWADKAGDGFGVALLNRGLPDYTLRGGKMSVTLLRSIDYTFHAHGDSPDALGLGAHRFEYALSPHEGPWQEAGVAQTAWSYGEPITSLFVSDGDSGTGELPQSHSYLKTTGSVAVTAWRIRDGEAELDLQELSGRASEVTISPQGVGEWRWTNALGDKISPSEFADGLIKAGTFIGQQLRILRYKSH